jgi:hypothetical protein
VAADGTWSCSPSVNLTNGSHSVSAVQQDPTGVDSAPSTTTTFTVDAASGLAFTGTLGEPLTIVGIALFALGWLLVLAGWRGFTVPGSGGGRRRTGRKDDGESDAQ